tara:strand:- start:8800 stop:9132 length:333 start_codon:yes stop_codon:yes gene_type:complete
MSFFDSEVVRAEVAHIAEMQEDIYQSVWKFASFDDTEKLRHVTLLQDLLEKQRVLYTRLSLSDDPEAKKMKENIMAGAASLGLPKDVDMSVVFGNMEKLLEQMKSQVDKM